MIKREGKKFVLYTADGKKVLGRHNSRGDAKRREMQIQWFKSHPK